MTIWTSALADDRCFSLLRDVATL